MKHAFRFVAIICFTVAACLEPAGSPELALDSATVIWPSEHLVEIGRQIDGAPGETFTEIIDASLTPDGQRVVVLDAAPPFLRFFDRQGSLVGTAVPEGDGPGESRRPHAIAVRDSTVLVLGAGRVTIVNFDGREIARSTELGFFPMAAARGCGADWTLLGPGPTEDGRSTSWLHVVTVEDQSIHGHPVYVESGALAPEMIRIRRNLPMAANGRGVFVYHDAADPPIGIEMACPDYGVLKTDYPARDQRPPHVRKLEHGQAVTLQTDVHFLRSVFLLRDDPVVALHILRKTGAAQELFLDASGRRVRRIPPGVKIYDVQDSVTVVGYVSAEPVPYVALISTEDLYAALE